MPRYTIQRTERIDVSADRAIAAVADFRTWQTWSPWLMVDPEAVVTISENSHQVGSTYHWQGDVCGSGQLTHTEIVPASRVTCRLQFFKPMKSVCETEFTAIPVASNQCDVTWTMRGKLPWFLFWMKGMLETFVGMDYERGLLMLKEFLETGKVSSKLEVIGVEEQPKHTVSGIREGVSMDEIGERMASSMARVKQSCPDAIDTNLMTAFYHPTSDIRKRWFDYTVGFLDCRDLSTSIELETNEIPAGRFFVIRHIGNYQHLGNAWMGGVQLIRHRKLKMTKAGGYEIYRCSSNEEADLDAAITDVYIAIR